MSMPSTRIGPFRYVVEAADQVDQRGLARAAGADQPIISPGAIVRSTSRSTGRLP